MRRLWLILALVSFGLHAALPWGFWAHKRINRIAVFTLPQEMFGFYKHHIEYITASAVNPDKRRYSSADEAPRHYIDIDHYGTYPFDNVPRHWDSAVAKFTEDTLLAYGIVPWHVNRMMGWLTAAFREKDAARILRLSTELGHYIADAHVPLHTTENYNGQLTNQVGIHGFWESRIPELFGDDYDYFVGKAKYIEHPLDEIWDIVLASHRLVDSVLLVEKKLREEFPADQVYSFEQRGNVTAKVYSEAYTTAYDARLNNMAERRLRESVIDVGSFWFTAWVNAGQPDLDGLINQRVVEELQKENEMMEKDSVYSDKKIIGREHPNTGEE
ncbi:MAG TPA: zinc dependent phospholipase C family protein [Chitinophagales bacterium]|nr:zinc dependent phospholipase C family protein [Chitinophagales bacterium]